MGKSKKWVIKAGSSLVTGIQEGINNTFIKNLIKQVDYLLKNHDLLIAEKKHISEISPIYLTKNN